MSRAWKIIRRPVKSIGGRLSIGELPSNLGTRAKPKTEQQITASDTSPSAPRESTNEVAEASATQAVPLTETSGETESTATSAHCCRLVSLESIIADPAIQARVRLSEQAVREYAQAVREGAKFPPIAVFAHDGQYLLADGFHRREAAKRAGLDEIEAEVREGGRREAVLHAVQANRAHGVRRSCADKDKAVTIVLTDPEWGQWSDRDIARRCGVSHGFVAKKRRLVTGSFTSERRRFRHKHGAVSEMDISNLGKSRAAPASLSTCLPARDLNLATTAAGSADEQATAAKRESELACHSDISTAVIEFARFVLSRLSDNDIVIRIEEADMDEFRTLAKEARRALSEAADFA